MRTTEHMPSRPLQLAEEALRSVLDETVESVEHLNYFIRFALPKIVKSLLIRRYARLPTAACY